MILLGVWKSGVQSEQEEKSDLHFRITVISASKNCPKCPQVPGKSGAGGKPDSSWSEGVCDKKWDKIEGEKLVEFVRTERSQGVIDV